MARRGGLGTNLDALIPTSLTVAGQEVATQNEKTRHQSGNRGCV